MRLIDADAMRQDWLENGQNEYVYDTNAVLDSIDEQPTIDPERLVVLPCKIGDTVYEVHRWKDGSGFVVKSTMAGLHLFDEKSRKNLPRKEYMVLRCNGYSKHVDFDKLGKTVFLTLEEAEAALKGGTHER